MRCYFAHPSCHSHQETTRRVAASSWCSCLSSPGGLCEVGMWHCHQRDFWDCGVELGLLTAPDSSTYLHYTLVSEILCCSQACDRQQSPKKQSLVERVSCGRPKCCTSRLSQEDQSSLRRISSPIFELTKELMSRKRPNMGHLPKDGSSRTLDRLHLSSRWWSEYLSEIYAEWLSGLLKLRGSTLWFHQSIFSSDSYLCPKLFRIF